MLYFTRWKALAIILTALVVCLCAVPYFFPEAKVKTWPLWAQRHIVLGLDLQGGSYLLLEVDSNYVKKAKLDQVRADLDARLRVGSGRQRDSRNSWIPLVQQRELQVFGTDQVCLMGTGEQHETEFSAGAQRQARA